MAGLRLLWIALIVVAASCVAGTARADAQSEYLLALLSPGASLDRYLTALRQNFALHDANQDGVVDSTDVGLHRVMDAATLRSTALALVMRADLDGDGVVTEDEVRRYFKYMQRMGPQWLPGNREQAEARLRELQDLEVKKFMAADADHDGRITIEEAMRFNPIAPGVANNASAATANRAAHLIDLFGGAEHAVRPAQLEGPGEALFRTVDADHNGIVSAEELKAYRANPAAVDPQVAESAKQARQDADAKDAAAGAACAMPAASEAAKVVVLGAYNADAVSTTALGSQDVAMGTGLVWIERGDEPIYLVMTSLRPVIWRLTGAVSRIERLVLVSGVGAKASGERDQPPLVGATGIAADRVSFTRRLGCLPIFTEAPSVEAAKAGGEIKRAVGKEAAVIAGRYAVSSFTVPSGHAESSGAGARQPTIIIEKNAGSLRIEGSAPNIVVRTEPPKLEDELLRVSPGGVVDINPKDVVSSSPAERYEVLPREAGLLQLMKAGALTRNGRGDFLVQRKIRLPAGMSANEKFLVLRGVPAPDGDATRSCVMLEEIGKPLDGSKGC